MGMLDRCKRQPKPRSPDDDDEDPEEEIARNLWANFKMFPPKSRFKHHWDRLMVALVMYNTFCIIIVVCFNRYNPYSGLYYYEVATDQTLVVPMVIDYIVVRCARARARASAEPKRAIGQPPLAGRGSARSPSAPRQT